MLGLLAVACRASESDLHLAPFYTRISTGDGRVEVEAAGGLWRDRRSTEGRLEQRTVGPLYGFEPHENRDWRAHMLVPLGYGSRRGDKARSLLFPIYIWGSFPEEDGTQTWQLAALPGLLVENNDRRGTQFGIFPLWGRFHNFVTFDHLLFVLWPVFVYAERGGRISYNFLWPLVGWTYGGGERSIRIFPFYARARWEGRYDRTFILWPIFNFQRNHLGGGDEEVETKWLVFPLIGRSARGTYRAWTWLWPFFGYSYDRSSGFWALDFPFPLVRLQRGPEDTRRTRFWPFYSYLRAGGLEARTFLWPIIHVRHEDYEESARDAFYVIPVWQSWDRLDKLSGEESSWRKLFPIFQHERRGAWERGSFPTLDPFWKNEIVDRFYSWIWKLYEWEEQGEMRRERSWLGLYRRERGRGEDRRSLSGIWSSRRYRSGEEQVRETSILFGLLRWRVTEAQGFDMLPCAFPGPGWPAHPGTRPGS